MEYSEKEYSLKAGAAKGRPLPDWALNEPLLYRGDDFFLTAFYELDSCRQVTDGGPGPIPWRDKILYANVAELDTEMTAAFTAIIREMDAAYLKWARRKHAAATKPPVTGLRESKNARIRY